MNLIQAILTQKTQLSALAVGYAIKIMGFALKKKKNYYGVGSKLKLESPSPCSRIFLAHVSCWQQTKPTIISSILGNRSASTSPLLQIIHNDLRASMGNKNSYNITFLFSPPITLITSFF